MKRAKSAFISGASRGLGLALAEALAVRGWRLLIDARGAAGLEEAHEILATHTETIAVAGDVADAKHRHKLAEAAASMGGLDAIVNNASILGPSPQPPLLEYPLETLEEVFRVNVFAPLALVQMLLPYLRSGARIVNLTSDAAVEPYPGWGGYGSSKAALEQLTAVLAVELLHFSVYWVDPGDMQTQMHQDAFPGEDISGLPSPASSVPGFLALLEGNLPNGRYLARELVKEAS